MKKRKHIFLLLYPCVPKFEKPYMQKRQKCKKGMQKKDEKGHTWRTIHYVNFQTTIGKSYAPPVLTRGGTTIGAVRSETFNAPFRKYTPDDWYRRNQGTF